MYVLIFSPQFPRLFYWSTAPGSASQQEEDEEAATGESYLRVEAELEDISTQTELTPENSQNSHRSAFTPIGNGIHPAVSRPTSLLPNASSTSLHHSNSAAALLALHPTLQQIANGRAAGTFGSSCSSSDPAASNTVVAHQPQLQPETGSNREPEVAAKTGICWWPLLWLSYFAGTMCPASNKKLLMITTSVCACASFAFLTIAVATDYWIKMTELKTDGGVNGSTRDITNTGLWNRCNITVYGK